MQGGIGTCCVNIGLVEIECTRNNVGSVSVDNKNHESDILTVGFFLSHGSIPGGGL